MSTINDGGPAFPVQEVFDERRGEMAQYASNGMSLRDYAAIHSLQPGCIEIVAMAGLVWSANTVWEAPNKSWSSFDDWWASIPPGRRFELLARVRYAQADAMIAARESK